MLVWVYLCGEVSVCTLLWGLTVCQVRVIVHKKTVTLVTLVFFVFLPGILRPQQYTGHACHAVFL